ncbi:Sugar phosphate isomerase/epimerase [Planctomycetales bacterium 10988]|nr:Sugar phosphate isomerase/epimerase [Planctomycetales bacterium 10988]
MSATPSDCLSKWVSQSVPADAFAWLEEQRAATAAGETKPFYLAFGLTARKLGKADLSLSTADLEEADTARSGWNPANWSIDQAARTLLVLALPIEDFAHYLKTLDRLFAAAEVGELVALYQALPLLPSPLAHQNRAAEGIRTNMKSVFCAVAHHNPYPSEQLDENAWNQMILKCLFVGVKLDPVIGLDQRANANLASMLLDYAHERWAANRDISPELWRMIGPYAAETQNGKAMEDLNKLLKEGRELEQQAAILALRSCQADEAQAILQGHPKWASAAEAKAFTWSSIAAAS